MILRGTKTEDEYRAQLRASRDALFHDPSRHSLLAALRTRFPGLRTAAILGHIPEQDEDLYTVLIDADHVAYVELKRGDVEAPPSVRTTSRTEYERGLSSTRQIQLAVALDLAMQDLTRER